MSLGYFPVLAGGIFSYVTQFLRQMKAIFFYFFKKYISSSNTFSFDNFTLGYFSAGKYSITPSAHERKEMMNFETEHYQGNQFRQEFLRYLVHTVQAFHTINKGKFQPLM